MKPRRPPIAVVPPAALADLIAGGRPGGFRIQSLFAWVVFACLSTVLNLSVLPSPLGAYEIAILKSANIAAYNQAVVGFKSSMPPDTVFVEYDLKGDPNMGRMYAGKIRASGADLVLAVGSKAATAARLEILDIPVIYSMVLHPTKYDLKAPNLVGVTTKPMIGQQLGTLRTIMPNLKRIGYLYDPNKTPPLPAETTAQARQFGITFVERQVRSTEEVPPALRELLPDIDALWLVSDSTVLTEESFSFLLRAAFDRRIPVIGFDPEFSRRGALISFWIDPADIGREAASIAHTILTGGTASAAKSFAPRQRLALNLGTAEYLGIAIPPTVQSMADEVY
ncbi:MAG: ABC transporter substrate-binding protein [Nitrospira sp.]|nr:ABC transporter substrate-binding protein [Nitrospira sp.]MCP9461538.1 ABC transporter substrate-binding protein [Nitrospira sp.]MCP9473948.1 ABC transporter substrate-binding protein [Nitrospira sp.]